MDVGTIVITIFVSWVSLLELAPGLVVFIINDLLNDGTTKYSSLYHNLLVN